VNALEDTVARNLALVDVTRAPTFVSTPDLLRWVPGAAWCPVSIDVDKWRVEARERESAKHPIVAYAPTHSWLKGADRVESTLHRLADEGIIEYRRLRGVPHAEMPRVYAEADIVLDQFALGSYGVAACEAMASGKPVLGHVDEYTRSQVRELTGWELPVHETTVETLEAELRRAADEPEVLGQLGVVGQEFVAAVHDGRRSAEALAGFLGLSASTRPR
jgi:glycosyltransferase involved in cell wall biosynthesis